jgi:hypothetical protein
MVMGTGVPIGLIVLLMLDAMILRRAVSDEATVQRSLRNTRSAS